MGKNSTSIDFGYQLSLTPKTKYIRIFSVYESSEAEKWCLFKNTNNQ